MGWIVMLLAVVIVIVLTRKFVDRETSKNLKSIGKGAAMFFGGLLLLLILSFISR